MDTLIKIAMMRRRYRHLLYQRGTTHGVVFFWAD